MNKILEKKSCQVVYLEVKQEGHTKQNISQGPEQDGRQVIANEISRNSSVSLSSWSMEYGKRLQLDTVTKFELRI